MKQYLDVKGNWLTGYKVNITEAVANLDAVTLAKLFEVIKPETFAEAMSFQSDKAGHIMCTELEGWYDYVADDWAYRMELTDESYAELGEKTRKEHLAIIKGMEVTLKFLRELYPNNV